MAGTVVVVVATGGWVVVVVAGGWVVVVVAGGWVVVVVVPPFNPGAAFMNTTVTQLTPEASVFTPTPT
jgi:hypothetical protein